MSQIEIRKETNRNVFYLFKNVFSNLVISQNNYDWQNETAVNQNNRKTHSKSDEAIKKLKRCNKKKKYRKP